MTALTAATLSLMNKLGPIAHDHKVPSSRNISSSNTAAPEVFPLRYLKGEECRSYIYDRYLTSSHQHQEEARVLWPTVLNRFDAAAKHWMVKDG